MAKIKHQKQVGDSQSNAGNHSKYKKINNKVNTEALSSGTLDKENEGKMLPWVSDTILFPMSVLGIYICYFTYGYLQEEIIAVEHVNAGVPLFMQYLVALLISLIVKLVISSRNNTEFKLVRFKEMRLGFINSCAMFSSNYALTYVDYPTQALFKSSKILPVMGVGLLRKTYSYSLIGNI
ncbi:unnamed protein product [Moneuplotes crassus]|uniref:Uncharacterized protein n=1 Tax=Euplotes crassus TaxID=5936 RepID=A0AAD1XFB7_EUPCR|nr:unnamed protein product [Moneuplotes crassus]